MIKSADTSKKVTIVYWVNGVEKRMVVKESMVDEWVKSIRACGGAGCKIRRGHTAKHSPNVGK